MLIKSITKKGDPIPMTPLEAAPTALSYGIKKMNTVERVYWLMKSGITFARFNHFPTKDGWEAHAEGSAMVGYTESSTDRFYSPKKYSFKIVYKSSKDALGLPDIAVDSFECLPIDTNPSNNVGPVDRTNSSSGPVIGELMPEMIAPPQVEAHSEMQLQSFKSAPQAPKGGVPRKSR